MEIISRELIKLDIRLENKDSIIDHIVENMDKLNRSNDKEKLLKDIYWREEEASTSMGFGVAIPHAQSSAVLESTVYFLRLKDEVDWNEDSDVRMVFGIFVPSSNPNNQHLNILAKIARKLVSEDFRNELLKAKTIEECEKLLRSINE